MYQERIDELTAAKEKIDQELLHLHALADLEGGKVQKSTKTKKVTASEGKRRGRPKKVVSDATETVVKRGRGRPKKTDSDGKSMSLNGLLMTIARESEAPLTMGDFVSKARQNGYKSTSANFGNMVYQALVKLVKEGKFRKNSETKAYEFIAQAA